MASYQARRRDPFLDSATHAMIERRGYELVGVSLFVTGLLFFALLFSYHANDPSWMYAADAPVYNWLGSFGASISAIVVMIVGAGFWVVPLALIGWGVRFVSHQGRERISRALFLPIALVTASLYAATFTPPADWPQNFGYGGLFGDTLLGMLLTVAPIETSFGVKLISALMGLSTVILLLFSLGFSKRELINAVRFGALGCIMLYVAVLRAFGKSAAGLQTVSQTIAQKRAAHMNADNDPYVVRMPHLEPSAHNHTQNHERGAESLAGVGPRATAVIRAKRESLHSENYTESEQADTPVSGVSAFVAHHSHKADTLSQHEPEKQSGLFSGLLKRSEPSMPELEPELVANEVTCDAPAPTVERVNARISDAIQKKKNAKVEPSFAQARKPQPLVFQQPQPEITPLEDHVSTEVFEDNIQEVNPFAARNNHDSISGEALLLDTPIAPIERAPVIRPALQTRVQAPIEEKKVVQHPLKRSALPSKRALAESQPTLKFEDKPFDYEMPPLSLLAHPNTIERHHLSDEALEENARMLENVLDDYGVKGEIISVRPGPVVTMYELEPAPGLKASRVIGLADDIARSMSALSARVSTVPGRSVIGIELPNEKREMVVLREMISARDFGDSNMKLPLALGKDISGEPIVANLAKMPHLLIAGTTGSGKSVAINTMILSLLYKLTPQECRMIMIDPKMLELSVYDGIPHLLSPVVTDPKKAVVALKWVVGEMEERYRKMSKMGVRNIDGYNGRVKDALAKNEMFSRTVQTGFDDETGDPVFETEESTPETLPYIVVVVDEMADLMMVAGKEIEACIQRLAQMARASGIHLIMATQRPSVDVITGTIKANFPTRISFQVTSKIDSRTILGEMGAEQLLGMGDMLYMAGGSRITRVHGPFCSDEEVEEIVNYLKAYGPPDYISGVLDGPCEGKENDIDLVLGLGGNTNGENALYDQAVAIVAKDRKCSTSYIQRKLSIGYNKAARLVEQMEDEGLVSSANHVGKREILIPEQH